MDIKVFSCSSAIILILLSCSNNFQAIDLAPNSFSRTTWLLQRIDSINGGIVSISHADTILLTFVDDRRISGTSPGLCGNTYFGVYYITSDDSIRVDSLATTKIYCPNSQYHQYYDLLMKAEYFQRFDGLLNICCDHGSRRLVFRRVT